MDKGFSAFFGTTIINDRVSLTDTNTLFINHAGDLGRGSPRIAGVHNPGLSHKHPGLASCP